MAEVVKYLTGVNGVNSVRLHDERILQPFTYLRQQPGKGVIGLWMSAFNFWLKVPDDKVNDIADLTLTTHDASLLVDDVEDNSPLRRGLPSAHVVYGAPSAINCAYYAMFQTLEKAVHLGHPDAVSVFLDEILKLHHGQGLDIYWRDNCICPTEEEYFGMIKQKTSRLLPIRLMQLFSENKSDYTKLADIFSVYYQIHNDYSNLCDQSYADSKTYCEDLTEGKFSFPIIHALKGKPGDSQIMHILRMRTTDNALKKHCVSLLEECGSLQYTREVLIRLDKELRIEIQKLGGNLMLEKLLNGLLTWQKK